MAETSTFGWSGATFTALSMTLLGRALQLSDGALGTAPTTTIAYLTLAIATALLALFLTNYSWIDKRVFLCAVAVCLMVNFAQLVTKAPCRGLGGPDQLSPFVVGFILEAFLCGVILTAGFRLRALGFIGVLLIVGSLGGWVIINRPHPPIDVFVFQNDASSALSQGHNPYDMTFPNIFAPDVSFYGQGVVQNDRLQFGYPYFPETLFAIMPAKMLKFDVRYTQLAAIIAGALLIVTVRPNVEGFAAALLLITTPRLYFVLEQSWIEPICLLMLVATVASALKWPRLLPVALGLFLASKQYLPFAAVLFVVGARPFRKALTHLFKAGIVAIIVTLPLALWNVHAFWNSVIALQFRQPFRADALSYLAWMGERFWKGQAVVLIPFVALFAATAVTSWRRKSVGFAGTVAFCFLMFFAFNKQAFANYYFFVIGAMACEIIELLPLGPSPSHDESDCGATLV